MTGSPKLGIASSQVSQSQLRDRSAAKLIRKQSSARPHAVDLLSVVRYVLLYLPDCCDPVLRRVVLFFPRCRFGPQVARHVMLAAQGLVQIDEDHTNVWENRPVYRRSDVGAIGENRRFAR
jgi:hypothetical protein